MASPAASSIHSSISMFSSQPASARAGTEAAAEFLSSNSHIAAWQAHLRESRHANAEVVLSTEIIEGKSGPPKVIASAEW